MLHSIAEKFQDTLLPDPRLTLMERSRPSERDRLLSALRYCLKHGMSTNLRQDSARTAQEAWRVRGPVGKAITLLSLSEDVNCFIPRWS